MVSSYSTDLKLELMVTGENAGTWGDITNTNLVILQQAIAGYQTVALNATTGATLTFTNGATSNGKNAVIELTGTITGNVSVIIPDGIEKTYLVKNGTSGAFTVQIKTTSGTGPTFVDGERRFILSGRYGRHSPPLAPARGRGGAWSGGACVDALGSV